MNAKRWFLVVAAIAALCGWAWAHDDADNNNAQRHGYRHGYVDGFHHGQEDRRENESYDFHSEDFSRADRGYNGNMGDKDDFQNAYRKGYRDGYDDGFYNRTSRYGEDEDYHGYWSDWNRGPSDNRNDSFNGPLMQQLGNDPKWQQMDGRSIGWRAGVEVGLDDFMNHRSSNPKGNHRYEEANEWYNQATDKRDWTSRFRHGFVDGYQQAYNNADWHNIGGQGTYGDAFRLGMLYGMEDTNRGKPYNPTRIDAYKEHSSDAQYQDGFTRGYGWAFQIRGLQH